ncbi:MAG: lysylphosphatidylglycerol synthase transmembrane domain-containing protein [Bacteroidota bacterium]
MASEKQEVLNQFRFSRMIWPILIGLSVLAYAIYQINQVDLSMDQVLQYTTWSNVLKWAGIGFLCMIGRDLGYIIRMRILTDKKLSWRAAFEVTLLWEFSSALTPSIVGGSAVAIFMLLKEKISLGRSTAIIFITIFLDEVFYVLTLPIALIWIGHEALFNPVGEIESSIGTGLITAFWIAYGVIVAYTIFLAFALFIRPEGTSRVFRRLFKTRLLKRWEDRGDKMAEDLLTASYEFRTKPVAYWAKAFGATVMAWMGRYLVLNCVLAAFTNLSLYEHTVAFGRQAIMFVVMIVSPTPGSSGIAEGAFTNLFSEFAPPSLTPGDEVLAFMLILATVWRLITYYPYVLIGVPLLPRWISRVFK